MSLLFKHLRVHQVFGANTDVGKTLLTAALVRASAASQKPVFYLKPVSTGPPEEADDGFVIYLLKVNSTERSAAMFSGIPPP
jgi:bifunctional dethiobiotin synthetase / adenosylmethionine---8-amino-7-oxononanoate aminotransferase